MSVDAFGRDFAWLYPRQDQTCFLDGHVRVFAHFGAAPNRLVYDNPKAAVRKIVVGSERELASRFLALATHYLFEARFAHPRQGHDKGGVESRGKAIRWQDLVPVPTGPDPSTVSAAHLSRLDARTTEQFSVEKAVMLPLPSVPLRSARCIAGTSVSSRSLVKVDGATYSVSSYRHYIRELAHKPQALRQVADELIAAPRRAVRGCAAFAGRSARTEASSAGVLAGASRNRKSWRVVKSPCEITAALASSEPIQLAVRRRASASPEVPSENLPSSLVALEVTAGAAAVYEPLLGGVQ